MTAQYSNAWPSGHQGKDSHLAHSLQSTLLHTHEKRGGKQLQLSLMPLWARTLLEGLSKTDFHASFL